jgi:F-type H+-transporting ATPase subunit epsilon
MAGVLQLKVVTPERALVDEAVDAVQVPGLGGYLGILPGHAPLFSELMIGVLSYTRSGETRSLAVSEGFVEVRNDEVRVLADVAEFPSDIDVARAELARSRAAERMASRGDIDYPRAQAAEQRATVRIGVAGKRADR